MRSDFPIYEHHQRPLHYLDSAASSQKPNAVIEAISVCYREQYGPVHRGLYPLAESASEAYEKARQTLASFINATAEQIVFTRSATESINLVATGWAGQHLQQDEQIWISQMEHHSNYLPWQRVCREKNAELCIIPVDENGQLKISDQIFNDKTRLIAITQVSNVLGVINPISQLIDQARQHSIPVLVDAAQTVGHMPVDVQALDCDFLVASAHKMYGPTGIGFLYAKLERLQETEPLLLGGGMVDQVNMDASDWADIPSRFEAGSPNLAGAIGFATAAEYLLEIGFDAIDNHQKALIDFSFEALSEIDGIEIYGPPQHIQRAGIFSFNIAGLHSHDIAHIAAEHGVAIRAGHHCCQPLMQHLGIAATARASIGLYNNEQDILALVMAVENAKKILSTP